MITRIYYRLSSILDYFKEKLMMYDELYDTALKLSNIDFKSF